MAKKTSQYRKYTRSKAGNAMYFTVLFLAGAFSVLPLIYCVITSFKPLEELLIFPPRFFVNRPTVANYKALPSLLSKLQVPVSRYFFNSIFVALAGTFLHIIAASLAAFTFSKSRLKCRKALFWIVQLMLLYNAVTLAVPQYFILSKLGIYSSRNSVSHGLLSYETVYGYISSGRFDGGCKNRRRRRYIYVLENNNAYFKACLDDNDALFFPEYVDN